MSITVKPPATAVSTTMPAWPRATTHNKLSPAVAWVGLLRFDYRGLLPSWASLRVPFAFLPFHQADRGQALG